jgi:hypothetical protein
MFSAPTPVTTRSRGQFIPSDHSHLLACNDDVRFVSLRAAHKVRLV